MMLYFISSAILASRVNRVWAWVLFTTLESNVRVSAVSELARRRGGQERRRNSCPLLSLTQDPYSSWVDVITHHLITYDLDLLAITETWLTERHGDDDLLNICPTEFSAVHSARLGGRRGGGVALIYRESYRTHVVSFGYTATSFEYLMVLLQCNSTCIRLVIVYCPPSQSTKCSDGQFLSDFSGFLQLLVVSSGKLLIVGDVNIHVDVARNSTACKFLTLLDSFGLSQHIRGITHLDGHTLDLVISRFSDNVICECMVSALI
jgi:hypothetical protein